MFKRIDQSEWQDYICDDLTPIIKFLKERYGIQVMKVGLENVKAPDTVIYLDRDIPVEVIEAIKEEFSSNINLLFADKGVLCKEHYCEMGR